MAFLLPIIGAISSAVGAVGSFLGGLGIIGKLVIGIGLNVVSTLLQRQAQKKAQQRNLDAAPDTPGGVKLTREYGADVARQVACGLVGIAGHDGYMNSYSEANSILQHVFFLSDYYSTRLTRFALAGRWQTLDFDNPHATRGFPITTGKFAGRAWVRFLDGRQTAANAYLRNNANPPSRWSDDHIGIGMTMAIVTYIYDEEKLPSPPEHFFEFEGAPLYDWRKDSTKPGGSGPHRWGNVATHEFSKNPMVMDYNYRRGFSVNDDVFCGMEMDEADLPLARYTAAANICDETDDDDQARYECSIFLDCMATHGDNIEALMHSCGAMVVDDVEGSWPLVGSDQPIVATIEDDDLVAGAPIQFNRRRSMADLVNSIGGTYPNLDQLGASLPYPVQRSNTAVVVDRRTRDMPLDFRQVTRARQCAQIASIYLKENRLEASGALTLKPRWQKLKAGDWIVINAKPFAGLTYMVTASGLASLNSNSPRANRISVQQRAGSIYDGVSLPVIVFPTPPGDPTYLNELQDFEAIGVRVESENKLELKPAIYAQWAPITDVTVSGVQLWWWPSGQPDAVETKTVPADETFALLTAAVVGLTKYKVQHRLITFPKRPTARSAPVDVTTLPNETNIPETLRKYLEDRRREADELWSDVRKLAANVATRNTEDIVAWNYFSKQIEGAFAQILKAETIRVSESEAFAQSLTLLSARLETAEGQIGEAISFDEFTTAVNEINGSIHAVSTALTTVEAKANDATANGLMAWRARATPGGVIASFELSGKTTVNGTERRGGFYFDVTSTGAYAKFDVTKFTIWDGDNKTEPFTFVGGVAEFWQARIGTVVFRQIESANGKLVLKGFGSNASIEGFT
ncbi:MAG TPA: hypothetical protein VMF90_15045 [Rhizobiaceae bacterium]|nr:hypothetical protein [Rhizobiaceae bacterium]